MDWRKEAVSDLKHHEQRKAALSSLKVELLNIDDRITQMRSGRFDQTAVQGGTSVAEDRLINLIDEKDRKRATYIFTKKKVDAVDRALDTLNEQENYILDVFFINKTDKHVNITMEKYHIERSQVYRIKDLALEAFTRARYGMVID